MVIQCELCSANARSSEELHTHFSSHFTTGRCGNCHKQLILVDGQFYILQLHNQLNCNQNNRIDDCERGFGDVKTEIDELGCELIQDTHEFFQGASSLTKERKSSNESNQTCNEHNNADDAENDATHSTEVLPFEVVECGVIKVENEENISSGQVFTNQTRRFQCKYCQKYLISANFLRKHIKRIHLFAHSEQFLSEDECKRIPIEQIHTKITGEKCLKNFQCEICNKYFLRRDSLNKHKELHNQLIDKKEMKKIPFDQISVKPSGEMYVRKHKCTVCAKYFLTKTSLCSHMHSHKRATVQSDSSSAGAATLDLDAAPPEPIFVQPSGEKQLRSENCSTCGKYFLTKHSLTEHLKRAHQLERKRSPLTDEQCEQLPTEQILTTKTGERYLKQFKCKICDIYLMTQKILTGHLKLHEERDGQQLTEEEQSRLPPERILVKPSGEAYLRNNKCTICDMYFVTQGALNSHARRIHKRRIYLSESLANNDNSEYVNQLIANRIHVQAGVKQIREYKCEICNKYLLTQRTLTEHIRFVHESEKRSLEERIPLTEEESRNLPSDQVLTTTTGQKYLRKYLCDICGKYLLTKYGVTMHMKKYHQRKTVEKTGERYICDICNKEVKTKYTLKAHKETHAGIQRFICNYCGKGCRSISLLNQHLNAHTGVKPIKCTVCGKGFGDNGKLKVHQRVHTGEKPFKCNKEGCGRAYAHTTDLRRHLYGAHGIYTKKFECTICSRIFPENKLLTKHMKTHV